MVFQLNLKDEPMNLKLKRISLRVRLWLAMALNAYWLMPRVAGGTDVAEMNVTTVTELGI